MRFWWVNQGQTYKEEYNGGFLWAPISNSKFQTLFHWQNMAEVQSGDIIFSYVNGFIKKAGIALNEPYTFQKPGNFKLWENEGRRIDIEYYGTQNPISIKEIYDTTRGKWPQKYAPLHRNTAKANQGYLFEVPEKLGELILSKLAIPAIQSIGLNSGQLNRAANKTTKEAIIQARVGQGKFRRDLIAQWNSQCAVTKFSIVGLLIASHIKPWAISSNEDRLNPDNGLLLSPNFNALFDKFLISFSKTGNLIKGNRISWQDLALLDIGSSSKILNLNSANYQYLELHRELMSNKDL
ncbi:HNH endonuclease [Flavihumibacter sp. R14]|nr:HNH endonuclease [Flavihumibacter soli]